MYNYLYQILNIFLPLITTPYISRVLGVNNIGIYSYTYSIVSYFMMFVLLGINNYGNRLVARIKNDKDSLSKSFWSLYFLQLFLGILAIIIYIFFVVYKSRYKSVAMIQSLFLISSILDINWFYFGLEKFRLTVSRNMVVKILLFFSTIFLVRSKNDLILYTFLMAISSFLSQIILWILLKKYVFFYFPNMKDILKHLRPNIVLFIPVIAVSLYTSLSKIILGIYSTTVEVGYLESVNKLMVVPTLAISALCTVMMPRISNLVAEGNIEKADSYIEKSLKLSVLFSSPIVFGMSAVSKEFVPLFFGQGYEKCIVLIPIVVLAAIFISWPDIIRTQYLIPYSYDKIFVSAVLIGAIINILFNFLLVIKYQSLGAVLATLATELAVCIYQTVMISKKIQVYRIIKESLVFIYIGIFMYLCIVPIPLIINLFVTLLLKVVIGFIVYVTGVYLLKRIFSFNSYL